ncbi:aminomethyl-transferring glycine dehydrogenase subunit GcvPB [bacterium]|nr:aminomethyl-transferring glycine dehydrogenase subunit GcvPB [bacterium]
MNEREDLIFNINSQCGLTFPEFENTGSQNDIPEKFLRKSALEINNAGEFDVVRHFTRLSRQNHSVDVGFYPLGSCTMKYNPKINETICSMDEFTRVHPLLPASFTQGNLEIMWELGEALKDITGMDGVTLQPAAGAHGEFAGILMIRAYHIDRGDKRATILIPDSAHGTNPSSVAMCGYSVKEIKSTKDGTIDMDDLKEKLTTDVAGLMITNPNTLGLFETDILKIAEMVHSVGALLYNDGANLNAILGKCRPGDIGFDISHINLHKTFSTPHGGGGPGSGPLTVKKHLVEYLPLPIIEKDKEKYSMRWDKEPSIGKVSSFYGNFGVLVRALAYIKALGADGLKKVSETAVLNANYLKEHLKKYYKLAFDKTCMHEFVLSGFEKDSSVHTIDIAKRLLDYGYHAPTIYFPLIVKEAIMIEPTETESLKSMDEFIEIMIKIHEERKNNPELLHNAPCNTIVSRLDEVKAIKQPDVCWNK